MMDKLRNELVLVTDALKGVMISTLAVLTGFNVVNITDAQMALILAEFVAITGFLSAITRAGVTPNNKVALTTRDVGAIEAGKAEQS